MSWAVYVKFWFLGQGYEDHLTKKVNDIPTVERATWRKVDVLLCNLLWQSINPKLYVIYKTYKTCYQLWAKAKTLYTNDIQRFYNVVFNMVHLKQHDLNMF